MPVQSALIGENLEWTQRTDFSDFRLIMFKCLAINADEEDILDGMSRLDQAQELLQVGEFLLSHLFVFFDFVAGDRLHCSVLTRDGGYCVV
jgi:hypothetical protein